uniref:Uncharacterized protein n=1 Tax=Nelumbo nucifera TaxID=4432 RepID=A0A822ZEB9_NELNU|nr:TPA_asm: hypothetical protein HUJ06_001143 [Nelumbo nucifera]
MTRTNREMDTKKLRHHVQKAPLFSEVRSVSSSLIQIAIPCACQSFSAFSESQRDSESPPKQPPSLTAAPVIAVEHRSPAIAQAQRCLLCPFAAIQAQETPRHQPSSITCLVLHPTTAARNALHSHCWEPMPATIPSLFSQGNLITILQIGSYAKIFRIFSSSSNEIVI